MNSDDNYDDTKGWFDTNGVDFFWNYNDMTGGGAVADEVWNTYYHFNGYPTKMIIDRDGYIRRMANFMDATWPTCIEELCGI